MSAGKAKKAGKLSPLGEDRYLIRRGEAPIAQVFGERFGEELTAKFLDAATRAVLVDVKSETRKSTARGGQYAPPRSAVAGFAPVPLREAESAPVRAMALLLLTVLEHFEPGGSRVASRALWMGNPRAIHQPPNSLAGRTGRSVRELQRFLAVFRCAGILEAVQPPSSSGSLKGKKGHPYNVWILAAPMPVSLHETLAAWRTAHAHKARAKQRAAAKAPAQLEQTSLRESPQYDAHVQARKAQRFLAAPS
jgi:hypothetical protein